MVRGTSTTATGDDNDGDNDRNTVDSNFEQFIEDIGDRRNTEMGSYRDAVLNGNPNWCLGNTQVVCGQDGIPSSLRIETRNFTIDGNIEVFLTISEDTRVGFFTDEGGFRQISFDDIADYQHFYATNMGDDIIVICRN